MTKFLERILDRYGPIAMIPIAITFGMLFAAGLYVTIITNGLFLLIFPVAFAYMAIRVYMEGDKR
jgi:hypothetical protein